MKSSSSSKSRTMVARLGPGLAVAVALLASLLLVGGVSGGGRGLAARHSRIHSISEEGAKVVPEKNIFDFTFSPLQGNAGGGTQVTLTLNKDFPETRFGNFWCKFGEKAVPSQSYFLSSEGQRAVVCQAPSGPTRSYFLKISVDGVKFHRSSGPTFLYYS